MGLRELKKQETRSSILEAAVRRFRTGGFEGTRVRDVTTDLRISEATFFNYFPTKESVLEASGADLLDRAFELLHPGSDPETRSVRMRLEELAAQFATHFDDDRQLAELVGRHTRFFVGGQTEQFARGRALLADLFEEGQRDGTMRADIPATELAEVWMAAMLSAIQLSVFSPTPPTLSERVQNIAHVLLEGSTSHSSMPPRPTDTSRDDR